MKSRSETIAALADEIVAGVNRIPLGTVLDAMLEETLLSNDDAAMLIANPDMRLDILGRAEKTALKITTQWLESEARGVALVDERMDGDRWWQEQHDADAALGAGERSAA